MNEYKTISSALVADVTLLIQAEYDAFYHYRSLSNWCRGQGYNIAADFFASESKDELEHAGILERYLIDWNVPLKLPEIECPKSSFPNLLEAIKDSYTMEAKLLFLYEMKTKKILPVDICLFSLLQEMLQRQNRAVIEYSDMFNMLKGVEANKTNILLLESKIFA